MGVNFLDKNFFKSYRIQLQSVFEREVTYKMQILVLFMVQGY